MGGTRLWILRHDLLGKAQDFGLQICSSLARLALEMHAARGFETVRGSFWARFEVKKVAKDQNDDRLPLGCIRSELDLVWAPFLEESHEEKVERC